MIFDRYLFLAACLAAILIFPSHEVMAFVAMFMLLVVLPGMALFVGFTLWQELVRLFGGVARRKLIWLRWNKSFSFEFNAAGKRDKAIRALARHYGLTTDVFAEDQKDPQRRLLADAWKINAISPPVWQAPLSASDLAAHVARVAGLDVEDAHALEGRFRGLSPQQAQPGWYLRLRWARNWLLSWLTGTPRDHQALAAVYRLLISSGPHARLETVRFLNGLMFQKRLDAGLSPIAFGTDASRQLPPSVQRDLVVLHRLMSGRATLSQLRFTDPSRMKNLRKVAELMKHLPPMPAHLADPEQAAADQVRREAAEKAAEAARPPEPQGPPSPTRLREKLEEGATSAIYLRRAWPLIGEGAENWPEVNSHLGGLPSLPPGTPWPRNGQTGQPLHFLAQIDCAELPRVETDTPLPEDGTLLFFAGLDEEMIWEGPNDPGAGSDGDDFTRVLYVPAEQATGQGTPEPDDLPDIGHAPGQSSGGYADPGVRSHPAWPITAHAMRAYRIEDYGIEVDMARALHEAQMRIHLPEPTPSTPGQLIESEVLRDEAGQALKDGKGGLLTQFRLCEALAQDPAFPWLGDVPQELYDILSARVLKHLAGAHRMVDFYRKDQGSSRTPEQREALISKQLDLVRKLSAELTALEEAAPMLTATPHGVPVSPDQARTFVDWLMGPAHAFSQWHLSNIAAPLSKAIARLGQRAASDPALRARLPEAVIDLVGAGLNPGSIVPEHIMLGHAQAKTNPTPGTGVRLLVLDSDGGVDFMFCDVGVVEFWIDPVDLAARDFSRAYGVTAGG